MRLHRAFDNDDDDDLAGPCSIMPPTWLGWMRLHQVFNDDNDATTTPPTSCLSTLPTRLGRPFLRAFDNDDVELAHPLLEHAADTARVDAAPSGVRRRRRRDDDPARFLFEHAADTAQAAAPSGVRQRRRGACPPPARARRRHGSGGHPIARSTATTWWACSPPT